MTKLNEDMCKKLAEAGKGMYIHVDNTTGAEQMLDNEIAKMQHGEIESVSYSAMQNSSSHSGYCFAIANNRSFDNGTPKFAVQSYKFVY